MTRLFERLQNLENERTLDFVKASAPKKHTRKKSKKK
jgi:hypothetical protein